MPLGHYSCQRHFSTKFGATWELVEVPNRSAIILHWGNFPKDTKGCILLGLSAGSDVIFNSRLALRALNDYMLELGIRDFGLRIENAKTFTQGEASKRERCIEKAYGCQTISPLSAKGQEEAAKERTTSKISND